MSRWTTQHPVAYRRVSCRCDVRLLLSKMRRSVVDRDLIKDDEAGQILLMSKKTLANQRSRGDGPPFIRLPNGSIRYSRRALLAYIERATVVPRGAA